MERRLAASHVFARFAHKRKQQQQITPVNGSQAAGASSISLRNATDGVLLDAVIAGDAPAFDHCRALTDNFGMAQFARLNQPDLQHGYCVDDNARALLAAVLTLSLQDDVPHAREVGETALRFLEFSQRPDGHFHNLVDANGSFLDDIGSPDSFGRVIWACGVAARCAPLPQWRARVRGLLVKSLPHVASLLHLRPRAYALLGLAALIDPLKAAPLPPLAGPLPARLNGHAQQLLERLAEQLEADFQRKASARWAWWEDELTWGNARLPEALLRSAVVTGSSQLRETGMSALEFLASVTHATDLFQPIGNAGWFKKDGKRAMYDQQPIEACGMVDLWLAAEQFKADDRSHHKALQAFAWFLGHNSENLKLADPQTGSCHDGLKLGAVNLNMGAESTLSYVHAHAAVAVASKKKQL